MRVAIHQPNYAPWCGFFAKMAAADTFIFLDDAQMPVGRSYVSRTAIRDRDTSQWLSVPAKRSSESRIDEVEFGDDRWARKHLGTLQAVYGRAPFLREVMELIRPLYEAPGTNLADFNIRVITAVATYLGIDVSFARSRDFALEETSDDRLLELVRRVGGTTYVSGKGGQNYQDPEKFRNAAITLDVRVYTPIPYKQIHGEFVAGLSILDALVHCGRDAVSLLRYDAR